MIGLFNDCFPPIMDGVALTTSNYAQWLHHQGHDVCVVTPQAPEANDDSCPYKVMRYFSMPIPMRKPYRYGLPGMDIAFQRNIRRMPFTLVHAHCPFSSGDIAKTIAYNNKIPLVATFHSKYRADFERAIPNKYVVDRLIKNVVRFYEQADEVWIPQASVEETLREYGYRGRVEVVDNGNDFAGAPCSPLLKTQAKQRLGIAADMPMLLFVGQHIWEKNIGFILQALALIKDVDYRMVFVGTGYAEDEIKAMAARLGLMGGNGMPAKVRFEGPVYDREQMRQYYLAANLFLFPSLYDNAPLVVREAAAMHTPAVMLAGSTASAVIGNMSNGFLSMGSHEAFARQVVSIITDRELMDKVGLGASQTLARTWQDVALEVNDRYNHIIRRYTHKAV